MMEGPGVSSTGTFTKPVDQDGFAMPKSKARKRRIADTESTVRGKMEVDSQQSNHSMRKSKRSRLDSGVAETDVRKIPVPKHRYTPLKDNWLKIFTPVVQHLKLQIRFNLKTRQVEIRASKETQDIAALQKAADFVTAFVLGFDVDDGLALIRLDDLFLETFEIADVKTLRGDHLSRAIGRIAGKDGRTKFTIENITKTRIVLADSKIHLLGSFNNIKIARTAICNLILGSPPSKVYGNLRNLASRGLESF